MEIWQDCEQAQGRPGSEDEAEKLFGEERDKVYHKINVFQECTQDMWDLLERYLASERLKVAKLCVNFCAPCKIARNDDETSRRASEASELFGHPHGATTLAFEHPVGATTWTRYGRLNLQNDVSILGGGQNSLTNCTLSR